MPEKEKRAVSRHIALLKLMARRELRNLDDEEEEPNQENRLAIECRFGKPARQFSFIDSQKLVSHKDIRELQRQVSIIRNWLFGHGLPFEDHPEPGSIFDEDQRDADEYQLLVWGGLGRAEVMADRVAPESDIENGYYLLLLTDDQKEQVMIEAAIHDLTSSFRNKTFDLQLNLLPSGNFEGGVSLCSYDTPIKRMTVREYDIVHHYLGEAIIEIQKELLGRNLSGEEANLLSKREWRTEWRFGHEV